MHLLGGQRIFVEYNPSNWTRTTAPCSYYIEDDSEIVFPQEVSITNTSWSLEVIENK